MEKIEIKKEEKKEDKKAEIVLLQVPSDYRLIVSTPEGNMEIPEYMAWLGNMVLEIKKKTLG